MVESINEKILEKIKSTDTSNEIKDFLIKMFFWEHQNFELGRWSHGKEYEKYIKHFANKYKVKE